MPLHPLLYLCRPPQPISGSRIGSRRRKPTRTPLPSYKKPHAFPGASRAGCDICHRHEASVGDASDCQAFDRLDVGHCRQNRFSDRISLAVKIQELDSLRTTYQRIIAACLEQRISYFCTLDVGTFENQGERKR